MIRKIDDFKSEWSYEKDATLKLFRNVTDKALGQKITPESRSLGRLAWHITISIGEMLERVGLKIDGAPGENDDVPIHSKTIAEAYERCANSVLEEISKWTDDDLLKKDNMYGETWERGTTLNVLIKHQAHHRAQMTVLMRQAGLEVPGIYGPSKEEWKQFNMEPMK